MVHLMGYMTAVPMERRMVDQMVNWKDYERVDWKGVHWVVYLVLQ